MAHPSGFAPRPSIEVGETRLCGVCATLIRYWPNDQCWRHAIVGMPHAPEPLADEGRARRAVAPETELELHAKDGNR